MKTLKTYWKSTFKATFENAFYNSYILEDYFITKKAMQFLCCVKKKKEPYLYVNSLPDLCSLEFNLIFYLT